MSSSAAGHNTRDSRMLSVIVTDAVRGRAAEGVLCLVERQAGGIWQTVAHGASDSSGTIPVSSLVIPGVYRITLDADPYFASTGVVALLPKAAMTLRIPESCWHSELRTYIAPDSQFSSFVRGD